MPRKFHLLAVGLVGAVSALAAQAEEVRPGQERFDFMLGAFLPAFNSDVQVDGETGEGDRVDLGNDLGLDQDETGYIVGLQWRFKEKHRLGFTYSNFTLNGERVIDEEITIRDEVYPINATLRTEQKLEIIPITYSYSFINNEQHEFAATAGIHWTSVTLSLRGSTDDGSFEASSSANADLPLPLFGVRYERHFSPSWSAGISASFFSIEFGESELDAKGSLANARLYGEYHFADRYSAGLALDAFKLSLDMDKTRWQGEYDYRYWGPQIYMSVRF
jgi:hypothetical protein